MAHDPDKEENPDNQVCHLPPVTSTNSGWGMWEAEKLNITLNNLSGPGDICWNRGPAKKEEPR